VVCTALALTGCATPRAPAHTGSADSNAADLAAIMAFNRQYLKAINDGDSAALSALTDDDHMMIGAGAPVVGKAALDATMARGFAQFKFDEAWQPVETVIDHNLAYQRGTFTVAATPKSGDGTTRTTHGNFLRIYRRQPNGSWVMTRDMLNTNRAAGALGPGAATGKPQ
jgi:ketosteroid isomerase-like protein